MKKDSDGMKNLAIVLALVVIVVIIVILLIKGCGVKEYTISFDSNGGSAVNSLTIKEDGTISEPTAPTREGYIFDGWYYNDEKFDFSTKITKDMTLEARWRAIETSDIIIDDTTLSLTVGSSKQVKATLTGEIKDAKLVWKSSDEKIATVDSEGNIKALKEGEVTITVSTEDGKYSKTITVTVGSASNVAVTKVTISGSKEVEVGKTIKLTANITPKNATNKNVTWKSSDTKVATVDKNGNVKGLKAGKVTITVTTKDGSKKASVTITVKEPTKETQKDEPEDKTVAVTGVSIKNLTGKKQIYIGETVDLQAILNPSNATNKNVTWSIDNKNLGSIATDGLNATFIAKAKGTVKVTVKTADGNKMATIEIEVLEKSTPVKTYTVTFDSNGGSAVSSVIVNENETVKKPEDPTKEGYEFVQWRLGSINGEVYNFNTKVTGNITLVAEWKAIYVITLKPYKQTGTKNISQYIVVSVKEGNKTIDDYKGLYFNGNPISKDTYVDTEYVNDGTLDTGKVVLKDGIQKTASIKYEKAN